MLTRPLRTSFLLATGLNLLACQRTLPAIGDGSATHDARASTSEASSSADLAIPDATPTPRTDTTIQASCGSNADCDSASFCDLERCDGEAEPRGVCRRRPGSCNDDGPLVCGCDGETHNNRCSAHGAGVAVAAEGACRRGSCAGKRCKLFDDCCSCMAYDANRPLPPFERCAADCDQGRCAASGLPSPTAYCASGLCLVGSEASCAKDSDCELINDCCHCVVAPRGKFKPANCLQTCFAPACEGQGLGSPRARCKGGRCRLESIDQR